MFTIWPLTEKAINFMERSAFVKASTLIISQQTVTIIYYSPSDPLGHGLSTVSPLWVEGHCTPRDTLASHTWSSGPWGGTRKGLRVTGMVAVIGRRSGALLMAPIGWAVGGRGRMVEGMELEVTGLAAVVVLLLIWVVTRGPESKTERQTGMQRKLKLRQQESKRQRSKFRTPRESARMSADVWWRWKKKTN